MGVVRGGESYDAVSVGGSSVDVAECVYGTVLPSVGVVRGGEEVTSVEGSGGGVTVAAFGAGVVLRPVGGVRGAVSVSEEGDAPFHAQQSVEGVQSVGVVRGGASVAPVVDVVSGVDVAVVTGTRRCEAVA